MLESLLAQLDANEGRKMSRQDESFSKTFVKQTQSLKRLRVLLFKGGGQYSTRRKKEMK